MPGTTRERLSKGPAAACLRKEGVRFPCRAPALPTEKLSLSRSAPVLPCEYCCFLASFGVFHMPPIK